MNARAWLRSLWVRVSIACSLVVLIYVWYAKGLTSAEMASWVQAIGALLAIALAIYLARSSAEREDAVRERAAASAAEGRQLDRKSQVQAACLVAESVCDALLKGYDALEDRLKRRSFDGALPVFAVRRGAEAITRIPAHEIPYTVVGRELMTLAICADQYLQLTADMRSARRPGNDDMSDAELKRILRSRKLVKTVQQAFEHLRKDYDGRAHLPITVDDIE